LRIKYWKQPMMKIKMIIGVTVGDHGNSVAKRHIRFLLAILLSSIYLALGL